MPHQLALVGRYLWRNNLPKATWNMRSDREQIPPKSTKNCSSKLHNIIFLVFDSDSSKGNTSQQLKLVGGFNPFERYFSNWIIPPGTSPSRGIQFWDSHLFSFSTVTDRMFWDTISIYFRTTGSNTLNYLCWGILNLIVSLEKQKMLQIKNNTPYGYTVNVPTFWRLIDFYELMVNDDKYTMS